MNLPELVQPVLTCFEDPDARVRYYACEALYNISKVARGAVLVFFNSMFDGLCKVSKFLFMLCEHKKSINSTHTYSYLVTVIRMSAMVLNFSIV